MFEPIALEVLLTPRKKVLVDSSNQLLDVLLQIRAHDYPDRKLVRSPLAISIVIDRSGSMTGGKLEEAKHAAIDIVSRLHSTDLVCVVVYDSNVETLMELMPAQVAKALIEQKLNQIQTQGTTNLHGGWLRGAEILAPKSNGKEVCRVILLSDGQTNRGITDFDQICTQVADLAAAGISTTTVGFGLGFNEELMTAMAYAGQGNAWYGERVQDLMESFDSEMSYLESLVFKEIEVQVQYNGRYLRMRNDYYSTSKNAWRLSGIAISSEKWMAFSLKMSEVIEIQFSGKILEIEIHLTDSQGGHHTVHAKLLPMQVVEPETYDVFEENELVSRRFQEVEMADIQREARGLLREGDWQGVEDIINELESRARNNPWILETVKYLRKLLVRRDSRRMQKELLYSSNSMKNRNAAIDDGVEYSMNAEAIKPAFLRKKTVQGRNFDSQV